MEIDARLELLCYAAAIERDTEVALEELLTESARAVLVEIERWAARN